MKGQTSTVTSEIAGIHRVGRRVDCNEPGQASRNLIIVSFMCHAKKMGYKFRGMGS